MHTHLFGDDTDEPLLPQASVPAATPPQNARAAQSRLEAILQAAPDAMLALDADGRITVANAAVASIFGQPPEELTGRPLSSVLPGLDAQAVARRTAEGLYMRASRTWVSRFETSALRQDGTPFPAEVSLSRTDSEDGALYACVVRDVTEQRMSLAMLHLFSQALDCTSNGVVISDMSLPGQPVFYANPAFQCITGYEPGEAIGRSCGFLQRDDTAQPEIDVLREAVRRGQGATVVLRNYRKDGSLFFNELAISPVADAGGQVRHYVGVLNDVTERERARLAIAERSARLNAVFDLSPDGFVVFDRVGRLVYTNRAFGEMTGLDLLGDGLRVEDFDRRFGELCDPSAACRPVAGLLDEEGSSVAETLHLLQPERRVLARVVRSHAAVGGESILFFRDITRETEVDRMKSEFLTTAAHELRTPMVSVFGFTELLLNRPVNEERRRDMLETIHRQASLLINMVNELLDLARIEARQGKDLKPRPCDLAALVRQAADAMMVAGDTRRVQVALAHADGELLLDPEKTLQAMTNVLSNAFKYSPEGGDISLHTRDGELEGRRMVGVTIRDRGIGMTPQQCQRVFERFYRADPSGNIPGTGLGMSLVKEIVELQGGRVLIDSTPGEGTAVTLWFPVPARQALPPAEPVGAATH